MKKRIVIEIQKRTRDKLKKIRITRSETYDGIINRLIETNDR